jgi:hypothetical protein
MHAEYWSNYYYMPQIRDILMGAVLTGCALKFNAAVTS